MKAEEVRSARLAAIRSRRGTPDREEAVDQVRSAHVAAQMPRSAGRPEGVIVDGFAHQLRPGDWLVTAGGSFGGHTSREPKRRFEDKVVLAGQTPRQRTRGTVVFARLGEWTFGTWYPVRYIRPENPEQSLDVDV